MKLEGLVVSEGIGIGKIVFYALYQPKIIHEPISKSQVNHYIEVLHQAIETSKGELHTLKTHAFLQTERDILEAHIEILSDPVVYQDIINNIKTMIHPSKAVFLAYQMYIDLLNQSDNLYMKSRVADMQDVKSRVLRHLDTRQNIKSFTLDSDSIIVCEDIEPSVLSSLDHRYLKGLISFSGTKDSHTSIMIKSLGIPSMVGVFPFDFKNIHDQESILDTLNKELISPVTKDTKTHYDVLLGQQMDIVKQSETYSNLESYTLDGHYISIHANIHTDKEDLKTLSSKVDGIGLLRSEFLYMEKTSLPTFETQMKMYSEILKGMNSKAVILRTLDMGGDKSLPYLQTGLEENPELGLRGIRRTLLNRELLYPQIKAALLSNQGHLKLMFPMISTVEEIMILKGYVDEMTLSLKNEGHKVLPLPIGIMIETPAAVLRLKDLLSYIDFASVGTNDLTQYILAVDRTNAQLKDHYKPYHPVIFQTLKMIADAFKDSHKELSICGELAGDHRVTQVLVGLGYRNLSMSKEHIGDIKKVITQTTLSTCEDIAIKVLESQTEAEVLELIAS
jgi:phosphoenolpyruvate-protein phosphotransferase (PTS system enzyme I)